MTCPAWCERHGSQRAGVQLHVRQVGALVRIVQEDDGPAGVEIISGDLEADPVLLEDVARQLVAAAEILRTS